MKHVLILAALMLLTVGQIAGAEEKKPSSPTVEATPFENQKTQLIQQADKRTTCLKAATNKESLVACEKQAKKERIKENLGRLEQQQQKIEVRKQRLQERLSQQGQPTPQQGPKP